MDKPMTDNTRISVPLKIFFILVMCSNDFRLWWNLLSTQISGNPIVILSGILRVIIIYARPDLKR